jgi:AcrR family transcriptional regulator
MNEKGVDALTMRNLADSVGMTPMAFYNHFSNKRALLAAIVEHVVGAARFDSTHPDWRDRVKHCFATLREICLQHPGLPGLLETEGVAPASVFAPMEVTVRALNEAGLGDVDSLRTYFLLVNYTLGQAAYQTNGPFPDLEPSERIRTERIAGRGYTATERLHKPATWDFDATFDFGLSLILEGIEATACKVTVRNRPSPAP